jgi:hypothetical protein
MNNVMCSIKFRTRLFVILFLVIILSAIIGCKEGQVTVSSGPNTPDSGQNNDGGDTGGDTGGGGNTIPTGTLAGIVDSSLLSDASCSASGNANAVYIFNGNTVLAVDQSGSNLDPIEIVKVSNINSQYTYSQLLAAGIYTIAFTCQADADIPNQAGDPVAFNGVTNVEIQANETTTHDFTVGNPSGGGINATIQAMPANSWYEVPNSQLNQSPVEAQDPEHDDIWQGNATSASGAFSYSGAAFDTKRDRLLIWGGGHHDYYGNEIYAFNLSDFTWDRLTDPSPVTSPDVCVDVLSDGNPNSRHTYYNLEYIPDPVDRFFSTPAGSTACASGGVDRHTWMFDFITEKWIDMAPTGTPVIGWAPTESAYNPLTNQVFSVSPGGLYRYDVAKNDWQNLNSTEIWGDRGVVVDTKRKLLVVVGHGEVIVYDIGNESYQPQIWETIGGEFNVKGYRPGVNYDPVADRIVVWHGGAVHALNMDTKEWTHLAVAPQDAHVEGTYGRFRYSPIENAYVAVNSGSENVLIYKLTEGGGKQ